MWDRTTVATERRERETLMEQVSDRREFILGLVAASFGTLVSRKESELCVG